MYLKQRIKKLEEQIGGKEGETQTLLIVNFVDPFPSGKEEGLEELSEDVKEWLTFKEQMQNPKVQPVNGRVRLFIKDPLKELEARKLVQGGNPE